MTDFIFISDFDGTITKKDFYWILLDDYIGQKGIDFYYEWKKSKLIGTEFLNKVFTWHEFTEEERIEALSKVEMDKDLEKVVQLVGELGGEFQILSAGFDYYIQEALAARNLSHLNVITNHGTFKENTFIMEPDEKSSWYSKVYGVDKGLVAKHFKGLCQKLYFVGDSEPDFHAAKYADVIFAKEELARLLDVSGIAYYPYENFEDIYNYMKQGI